MKKYSNKTRLVHKYAKQQTYHRSAFGRKNSLTTNYHGMMLSG